MISLLDIIPTIILEHELFSISDVSNNFLEILFGDLSSDWWAIVRLLKKWIIMFEYKDYSPFCFSSSLEKWLRMYDRYLWWHFVYFNYDYGWTRIILTLFLLCFMFELRDIEEILDWWIFCIEIIIEFFFVDNFSIM